MATSIITVLVIGLLVSQSYGDDSDQNDHNSHPEAGQGTVHKHAWSYNVDKANSGPDQWKNLFLEEGWCGAAKRRQSPINIELEHVKINSDLSELYIEVADHDGETTLKNNGHTAVVSVAAQNAFLMGGALKNRYRIEQFHFHWGSDDTKGSEHQINGKSFPLELHLVTYNSEEYDNILAAAGSGVGDALTVVGLLFKISEEDNPALEPIINHLSDVIEPASILTISDIHLDNILPKNMVEYFTYPGSLTTPKCFETVTWYELDQTQTISANQLSQFRALQEGTQEDGTVVGLMDNARPVQPLHGRVVQSSFTKPQPREVSYVHADGGASFVTSSASLIICLISSVLFICLKQ